MTTIAKRLRFVISSLILSVGLVVFQSVDFQYKLIAASILVVMTLLFSIWSLYEGLEKNMTISSLILPLMFTIGVSAFWFLLPANVYTAIPTVLFYVVGIYTVLSTMNIYNVAASKTIALVRAARGVGFVVTLIVSFLIFDAIVSTRQAIYISLPIFFVTSFLLFIQGFWSIELNKKVDHDVIKLSTLSALAVSQIALLIFFWPVTVVVGSLFLTSGVYLLLGLGQAKLEDRLFPTTTSEYTTVGLIVMIAMFLVTRWG